MGVRAASRASPRTLHTLPGGVGGFICDFGRGLTAGGTLSVPVGSGRNLTAPAGSGGGGAAAGGTAPELVTASDAKHQSAPNQHPISMGAK